ncbi:MAG: Ig-like domain repeat protein [Acidobacteriaceae bacterium]|nr:Ig-like domain repeat protein [Acidobacteriaceae bacterium]
MTPAALLVLPCGILFALCAHAWSQEQLAQPQIRSTVKVSAMDHSPSPDVKTGRYPTTTSLTSSLNPSQQGQNVLFTATVVASNGVRPIGTVGFYCGSTLFVTRSLTDGVAAFGTAGLPVGTISFTAVYSGTAGYDASSSPAVVQTVLP